MNIEELRQYCTALPDATEEIKWENDLCFCIGGKMFCVVGLHQNLVSASFKVTASEFDTLATQAGYKPAPYLGRFKWILAEDITTMPAPQLQHYLQQSYHLIREKLPVKIKRTL